MPSVIPSSISGGPGYRPFGSELAVGEIVVNSFDGKLYTLTEAGEVVEIGVDQTARNLADLAREELSGAEPRHPYFSYGWVAQGPSGSYITVGGEREYRDFAEGVRLGALNVYGAAVGEGGEPLGAVLNVYAGQAATGGAVAVCSNDGRKLSFRLHGPSESTGTFSDLGPSTAAIYTDATGGLTLGLTVEGTDVNALQITGPGDVSAAANLSVGGNATVAGSLASSGELLVGEPHSLPGSNGVSVFSSRNDNIGEVQFRAVTFDNQAARVGRTQPGSEYLLEPLLDGGVNFFGGTGNTVIYALPDGGSGDLVLATGALTAPGGRVHVKANGEVGIGYDSPQAKLHVNGPGMFNPGQEASPAVQFTNDPDTGFYTPLTNSLGLTCGGVERLRVDPLGNVGIGTPAPLHKLDVNDSTVRVREPKTPAAAGDTGHQGQICWDNDYIYVCVGPNTWKRAALSSW